MGVSGVGKTTIGQLLADNLGWPFHDADEFHSAANIAKLAKGIPLTDDDRAPWLEAMRAKMEEVLRAGDSEVFTSSALKAAYRQRLLTDHPEVRLVHLVGDYDLIRRRLRGRKGHFMSPELLASQFETLENPSGALIVNVDQTPEEIVAAIRQGLEV
jgi:gluconokinase